MLCEADRIVPDEYSVNALIKYLKQLDRKTLDQAKWMKKRPDKKKIRNPGWLIRSRLVSPAFHLEEPWKGEPHPVEAGTIIMVEKKLDGTIYISGIPITGIPD